MGVVIGLIGVAIFRLNGDGQRDGVLIRLKGRE